MKEKIDNIINKLAEALDKMFDAPFNIIFKLLDSFFEYSYRETDNGVFGLFDSPEKMKAAACAARDKGYTNFDCMTPFPIHGLEFDMGLKRSKIPYITFVMGLVGLIIGFVLQWVVHEQVIGVMFSRYFDIFPNFNSYPQNIGGKPSYSWPAMIPVCFELTILLAGHSTVAGLLLLSRIPKISRKILHPELTNDKFALWIPTDSDNYDEEGVKTFIGEIGGAEITVVKEG